MDAWAAPGVIGGDTIVKQIAINRRALQYAAPPAEQYKCN
jgi:hypothetical protein